jgi:hypothetical protein
VTEPAKNSGSTESDRPTAQSGNQPHPGQELVRSEDRAPKTEAQLERPRTTSKGKRARSIYFAEAPWILSTLLGAMGALGSYCFDSVVGKPGIAWWEESPARPPHELHVGPGEIYGRICLRNLTDKVFTNVGIQLQVTRGELVRGIFTPDSRDIVPASESRVMNTIEKGPRTAPYVLRQHVARFDPNRTWVFDYNCVGPTGTSLAMTEGEGREQFLELKGQTKLPAPGPAQPLELHRWNWKDWIFEWRLPLAFFGLALGLFGVVMFIVTWRKQNVQ